MDKSVISIIEKRSFVEDISQSKFLSHCITLGFEMMVDDFYDNNKKPLVGAKRKRSHTIPKTFTLPIDVVNTLNWFSKKLDIKKSHLVIGCVLDFERTESERLSQQIMELMDSVSEDDSQPLTH